MKRVMGVGGVFFKTKNAMKLNEWYIKHLGFKKTEDGGILFEWRNTDAPEEKGYTVWEHLKKRRNILSHRAGLSFIVYRLSESFFFKAALRKMIKGKSINLKLHLSKFFLPAHIAVVFHF